MKKTRVALKNWHVSFFVAITVGLLPLLWECIQGFVWETNDDNTILFLLSRADENWSILQGQILCAWIKVLYAVFPNVEWWAITTIATLSISSCVCVYILNRRVNSIWKNVLLTLILLAGIWGSTFRVMNFTRTAMFVSTAGALLVLQGIFETSGKRLSVAEMAIGLLLLLHGSMIRWQCTVIALFFFGIAGAILLLRDNFRFEKAYFVAHSHEIICLALTMVIVFSAIAFDYVTLSEERKSAVQYNSNRSGYSDFTGQFPS